MTHLQIIVASTRQNRQGIHVAHWFQHIAEKHAKFEVELVDLAEVNLPLFDEPNHPRFAQYVNDHTKAWSATVSRADAYVFVTPEYNYGPAPALINALDYLSKEWAYKPVGFVSYGGVAAGTRAVQATKLLVTTLKMMPMFEAVAIPFFAQHLDKETNVFTPGETQDKAGEVMLDELLRWADALKVLRA
ncbi:MAG: NADPH-dependent FMN reductase [Phototrophicaceae bacterium]|jgi:NAD(P)H-dependent FMN reductase